MVLDRAAQHELDECKGTKIFDNVKVDLVPQQGPSGGVIFGLKYFFSLSKQITQ
jgi:hypothetical protein